MENDLTNKQLLNAVAQMFAETNEWLDERLAAFATKEYLDERLAAFATKEYLDERLKAFATKEYLDGCLKAFATKEDLKAFATKEDLKAFATKEDLKASEQRLARKIDGHQRANIQHHLESRRAIGELGREIYRFREA